MPAPGSPKKGYTDGIPTSVLYRATIAFDMLKSDPCTSPLFANNGLARPEPVQPPVVEVVGRRDGSSANCTSPTHRQVDSRAPHTTRPAGESSSLSELPSRYGPQQATIDENRPIISASAASNVPLGSTQRSCGVYSQAHTVAGAEMAVQDRRPGGPKQQEWWRMPDQDALAGVGRLGRQYCLHKEFNGQFQLPAISLGARQAPISYTIVWSGNGSQSSRRLELGEKTLKDVSLNEIWEYVGRSCASMHLTVLWVEHWVGGQLRCGMLVEADADWGIVQMHFQHCTTQTNQGLLYLDVRIKPYTSALEATQAWGVWKG